MKKIPLIRPEWPEIFCGRWEDWGESLPPNTGSYGPLGHD